MDGDTQASYPGHAIVAAIRADIIRLHESWMGLVFPRQRKDRHPVLGKWQPRTQSGRIGYYLWAILGAPLIVIGYPLILLGLIVRFHTRSVDRTAARLGLLGVILVVATVWGILTVVARFQYDSSGFFAVLAAAVVATISAAIAVVTKRYGGRGLTIAVSYPSAMTAIFLPPVVAALFSDYVSSIVFPRSEDLAIWLLDNLLVIGGIDEILRTNFDLAGLGYVAMWLGIAVPLGWFLGILVSLTDVIRPSSN